MGAPILTTASVILCPHGAPLQLVTSNATLHCPEAPALLETDVHAVLGCPFVLPGPKASPCVKVLWSSGSATLDVDGAPVLTTVSVGTCESAEGAPQGVVSIVSAGTDAMED